MSTMMKGTTIIEQPLGMNRRGMQGSQVSTHSPQSIQMLSIQILSMESSSTKTKNTQIRNMLMQNILLTMLDLKEEEAVEEVKVLSLTNIVIMLHLISLEEEDREAEVEEEVLLISTTMRTTRKLQSIDTTMTIMMSTLKHTEVNMINTQSMIKLKRNLQLKNMRRWIPKKSQFMITSSPV